MIVAKSLYLRDPCLRRGGEVGGSCRLDPCVTSRSAVERRRGGEVVGFAYWIPVCAGVAKWGGRCLLSVSVALLPIEDVRPQVAPVWIHRFNQVELPLPLPLLDGVFALDRAFHRAVQFEPDQHLYVVLAGESFHCTFSVLPNALKQIGGRPSVQRAIAPAGRDVCGGLEVGFHGVGRQRLLGSEQIVGVKFLRFVTLAQAS